MDPKYLSILQEFTKQLFQTYKDGEEESDEVIAKADWEKLLHDLGLD